MSKIENPKYFLDHFSAIKLINTENIRIVVYFFKNNMVVSNNK
jgi:hypothetical protein